MNILIFNHYAVGPQSSGGTRHYDLAKELVKKGHKVTIFASSFNHQTLKEEQSYEKNKIFKNEEYDGVKFIWIKTPSYNKNNYKRILNMLVYSKRALSIAKEQRIKPDIVIGSLVHPLAAYVGYLVSKHYSAIFYFEERDLWPQTLIDLGKLSSKNPVIFLLSKIEKFLFKKASKIIVLFDKAVSYVENRGIHKEKILYIPNGYDIARTHNSIDLTPDIEKLFNELGDKTIAIYTGAHGLANNLDIVLNSAIKLEEDIRNVHFILIGNGPEKERLQNRVKNENITNVTMVNPIPKEMIPSVLEKAHVGLLPLVKSPVFKWGISPNKLFDYMGNSLPVLLLCDLEGTPVEQSGGGVVIKENFEDGVINFFTQYTKKEILNLGHSSREYVDRHHSWKKLAEELEIEMLKDLE